MNSTAGIPTHSRKHCCLTFRSSGGKTVCMTSCNYSVSYRTVPSAGVEYTTLLAQRRHNRIASIQCQSAKTYRFLNEMESHTSHVTPKGSTTQSTAKQANCCCNGNPACCLTDRNYTSYIIYDTTVAMDYRASHWRPEVKLRACFLPLFLLSFTNSFVRSFIQCIHLFIHSLFLSCGIRTVKV